MKPLSEIRHPIQPIGLDEDGRPRFKKNAIVRHLLDNGGIDLNKLAVLDFSKEDWQHFAQLIGYSLSGYSGLSYVTNDAYAAAERMSKNKKMTSDQARADTAIKELQALRESFREGTARLYGKHPDDLVDND